MNNSFLFILVVLFLLEQNSKADIIFEVRDEKNKVIKGACISVKSCNLNNIIMGNTGCNGVATFKGIIKDKYEVIICKQGYKQKKFLVNICDNSCFGIYLCSCKSNRLYGYVTDLNNKVVEKAAVVLYRVIRDGIYYPVRFTYTDFTGEYNFIDIPKGDYIVKAIK